MKNIFIPVLSLFLLFVGGAQIHAQNVFSEMDLDYKKPLLPYDVSYTIPLADKEFVMLSERKKNNMILARYDEYFFKKWGLSVQFPKEESVPQIFLKGDSIVISSYTDLTKQLRLTCRYFDVDFGSEAPATNYVFGSANQNGRAPKILFSENKSKFVLYNLVDGNNISFQIYDIGKETPTAIYALDKDILYVSKTIGVHLSDAGDLFVAVVDPGNFNLETYFWAANNPAMKSVSNNFFFERPANVIGKINIVRQSVSSYFVSFPAKIDEELIGFSVTGVNVALQTVMFSHHQNFSSDEIQSVYENYLVTSPDQKNRFLNIPKNLDDYGLARSFVNSEKDIILVFENLEKPSEFHENVMESNMGWNHTFKKEKFYFGGDLLVYCFSESGEMKWKKAIQKTQFSQGNVSGNSFIPKVDGNQLMLLCYESAKGGSVYVLNINTLDGTLTNKTDLFPNNKYEFIKKYSCWLNPNSVVVCGVSPRNISKRTVMLVEF